MFNSFKTLRKNLFLLAKTNIFSSTWIFKKKKIEKDSVGIHNKNAFEILYLALLSALLFLNPYLKLSESILNFHLT